MVSNNDAWFWRKKITHIHMEHLNKLVKYNLVIGLPKIKFIKDRLCNACHNIKQTKTTLKAKNVITTSRPLQLIHMDLFGPQRKINFGDNVYSLVIVNDFFRFSWTLFLV